MSGAHNNGIRGLIKLRPVPSALPPTGQQEFGWPSKLSVHLWSVALGLGLRCISLPAPELRILCLGHVRSQGVSVWLRAGAPQSFQTDYCMPACRKHQCVGRLASESGFMVTCHPVGARLGGRGPSVLSHLWRPLTSTGRHKVSLGGLSTLHTHTVSILFLL